MSALFKTGARSSDPMKLIPHLPIQQQWCINKNCYTVLQDWRRIPYDFDFDLNLEWAYHSTPATNLSIVLELFDAPDLSTLQFASTLITIRSQTDKSHPHNRSVDGIS